METLTAAHLLAFNAALFVAVIGPGPAFLVCVQASLTGGRRAGVLTGLGLAVMAGLWTLAALLGLETLFTLFPYAYTVLKIVGALIVLVIAVQVWRGARVPIETAVAVSKRRSFLRGFVLNLGNPKSILFAAGVLLVIFPPGLSGGEMALVTLNHIALEAAVYATLATLMSRDGVRARYLAFKPLLARATALVLGGLGLRLLVTS
ncbi:MAG: LysE family transporter [Jannaschia sp.]